MDEKAQKRQKIMTENHFELSFGIGVSFFFILAAQSPVSQ